MLWPWDQSCPRVTFLGRDPTRRNVDPTRPDPRLLTKSLTRPEPATIPSPICIVFNLIIIYLLNYYYNKCRWKSINPNVVFEDSYRFKYQEIISKKTNKSEVLTRPGSADPTRPAKIRQNRDLTRPYPTRPAGPSDRGVIRGGAGGPLPPPPRKKEKRRKRKKKRKREKQRKKRKQKEGNYE